MIAVFIELDLDDEETTSSLLGREFASGDLKLWPAVQEALDATDRGDLSHPIIRGLRGEFLILEGMDGLPEDHAWIWSNVIPPLDT